MIWSIMPEDFLFAPESASEASQMLSCSYLGRQLLVRPTENGQGEIVSLLSTDPADFLDARFRVGRIMQINN